MDDFLVFANDRKDLRDVKGKIRQFLHEKLNLALHEGKSQIYRTKDGIKFLGFRIYRDHRRLATDNVRRFRKRLKKFAYLYENGTATVSQVRDSVRSWTAHAAHADTKKLRLNIWSRLEEKNGYFTNALKDVLLSGIPERE